MLLPGKNGYDISYSAKNIDSAKNIIIAMHGFCGDKESSCILALEEEFATGNTGLIKFDWPGHGESPASGDDLTIENCLNDISSIVELAKSKSPDARIIAFATSFGGYLTLLYNALNREVFDLIILRSPAIRMYDILVTNILSPQKLAEVKNDNFTTYGFERDLKITNHFIDELQKNDLFSIYKDLKDDSVSIIHGTEDNLVPFSDSAHFADLINGRIYAIAGADHRYKKPGEIEKVINTVKNIIF